MCGSWVLELESSTPQKFSRHVLVKVRPTYDSLAAAFAIQQQRQVCDTGGCACTCGWACQLLDGSDASFPSLLPIVSLLLLRRGGCTDKPPPGGCNQQWHQIRLCCKMQAKAGAEGVFCLCRCLVARSGTTGTREPSSTPCATGSTSWQNTAPPTSSSLSPRLEGALRCSSTPGCTRGTGAAPLPRCSTWMPTYRRLACCLTARLPLPLLQVALNQGVGRRNLARVWLYLNLDSRCARRAFRLYLSSKAGKSARLLPHRRSPLRMLAPREVLWGTLIVPDMAGCAAPGGPPHAHQQQPAWPWKRLQRLSLLSMDGAVELRAASNATRALDCTAQLADNPAAAPPQYGPVPYKGLQAFIESQCTKVRPPLLGCHPAPLVVVVVSSCVAERRCVAAGL
jgi:hypothetical protein